MTKSSTDMLKEKLKTELRIVHLTSDDNVFLDEKKAMKHEWLLSNKKEVTRKESKMKEDKLKSIVKVLSRREWGIFFKGEPLTSLPVQDGMKVYRVNEVKLDTFLDELRGCLKENKEEECQNHQTNQNQIGEEL